MKFRIGILILVLMISISLVSIASAAESLSASFSRETRVAEIKGIAADGQIGAKAQLLVLKPNCTLDGIKNGEYTLESAIIRTDEAVIENEGGEPYCEFDDFKINENYEFGNCYWQVSSKGKVLASGSFYFSTLDKIKEALNAIDSADADGMQSTVATQKDILEISAEEYLSMTDVNELTFIGTALSGKSYACEEDATEEEVNTTWNRLKEDIKFYEAISVFNLAPSKEKMKEAIEKNSEIYGADLSFDGLFDTLAGEEKNNAILEACDNLVHLPRVEAPQAIKDYIDLYGFITAVELEKWDALKDLLVDYEEKYSLPLDDFLALSALKLDKACQELASKTFTTEENLKNNNSLETLKKAIESAVSTVSGGNKGSGGSFGGGDDGGQITIVTGEKETEEEDKPVTETVFADVSSTHWAKESIETLYEKGIINGKGKNKFYPADMVTRAEFAKLLITAFMPESSSDKNLFTDITENMWHSKYVNAAQQLGWIKGYPDGSFRAENNISREDMALMICRVLKTIKPQLLTNSQNSAYADSSQISAYAADSVSQLTSLNVLNGSGGYFMPKNSASRAEAAKVIASIMKIAGNAGE